MWYVIGSLNRQNELKIRDALRLDGKDCFVPLRYELVKVKDKVSGKKAHKKTQERKERQLVPAIPGMVFIKEFDSVDKMKDYFLHRKERVFLKKSTFTNKEDYLSVTDHDMENFMAITEKAGERITYYEPGEIQLRPGDRIRVNGGLYDGREGIIMRVKGKRRKQLVVSIPGVLIASVEMEPDLVELTSALSIEVPEKPAKSKNVEGDKQLVMRLAKRLLFEIPEAFQHEKEYYLLLSELKRATFRLQSMRGYVSSQEAELALALYLAAFKLQQNQEAAEARLRKAIDRLQDTSLLKVRAQMYLAVLSKDEKLFALVQERINAIKAQKLSMKQKLLLEDFESLSPKIVF